VKLGPSDGIHLLGHLFLGKEAPVPLAHCASGSPGVANGDTNGDRTIDLSDPIRLFDWLFSGKSEPVQACGVGDGSGAGNNPRVIPTQARAFGSSYEELAARWWEWAYGAPSATNPVVDTTGEFCDVGQAGKIWLVAGSFGGTVERTCTVPAGKAVFIALLNWVVFCPFPNETVDDLRAQVNELIDVPLSEGTIELEATIDGVPIQDLFSYRADSVPFKVPAGGLVEEFAPDCVETDAVADGYWLLLPPLSAGSHTIHFRSAYGAFVHSLFGPIDAFSIDITYELEVTG
jgi:hypothetical protein